MEYHDIVAGGGSAGWVAWPGSARPSSLPLWVPIILSVALIWSYAFRWLVGMGIWLRGHLTLGNCQYLYHYA